MRRYLIQLAFKGTNFHGWQRQKNNTSVQETLEKALSTALRSKTSVMGAGRTDAGVHAKFFVAHFDSDADFDPNIIVKRLNGLTPKDIIIHKIFEPPRKVHARFDALSRTYKYFVHTKPNPFIAEYSYYLYKHLNFDKIQKAAQILLQYEDFKAFSKAHSGAKHYLCKIYHASWQKQDDKYIFTIKANRFLRNMVRAITGTLLDIGAGRLELEDLHRIIRARDRRAASLSVPANGLFLVDIEYQQDIERLFDKNYDLFWQTSI